MQNKVARTAQAPRWLRPLKRAAAFAALMIFTTVLYLAHWGLSILQEVGTFTGVCPPGPLDIPPYPCSVADYVHRMSGGFGLFGTVFEWAMWVAAMSALFFTTLALRRMLQRRSDHAADSIR